MEWFLNQITLTADFVNQSAHHLASHYDPSGVRTIGTLTSYGTHVMLLTQRAGVLTKPDRIPTGEEAIWISRIQSSGDGGIEYFFVKNPDSMDIRNGISYAEAREQERSFFENKAPWSNLERLYQSRLGTDKLTRRLGQVLSTLISKRQVLSPSDPGVNGNTLADFLSCRVSSINYSNRLNRTSPGSQIPRHLNQFLRF